MNVADAIKSAEGISAITPDRLENLMRAAMLTQGLPGRMAELGLWRGGSALALMNAFPDRHFDLFDTFTGLPDREVQDFDAGNGYKKGDFAGSQDEVRATLSGRRNFTIHAGVFPASAKLAQTSTYCFVHIDCDLYRSAMDAIEWFLPRTVPRGMLFFDDYNRNTCGGVTAAVQQSFPAEAIMEQHDMYGNQVGAYVVKP